MVKYSDHILTGFIIGILTPAIAFSIFSLVYYPDQSIIDSLAFYKKGNVLTHVISLSVIANLLVFYPFLNFKKERTAKGIIGGSFIYVFIVLTLFALK
jgi:hypothetical protein